MSSPPPRRSPIFILKAHHLAAAHTWLACSAFLSALALGCLLHYKKLCKNGVATWPDEWWPSVSATIGDWYPERSIFHILIALTSGPRFALVFLQYALTVPTHHTLGNLLLIVGLVRTLSCGGWVYITSEDNHDAHDLFMILYIVCNIPWMLGHVWTTPLANVQARKRRIVFASLFFGSLVPLVYFFLQHKVHKIPGAYTRYAFFEWGLIFLDVAYDSIAELDLKIADLQIGVGHNLDNASYNTTGPPSETEAVTKTQSIPVAPTAESDKTSTETSLSISKAQQELPILHKVAGLFSPDFWDVVDFVSDVYLAYIEWSVYTSLAPTLFYFSVWELAIAGPELALAAVLSPALLAVPGVLSWARSPHGKTILRVFTQFGIAVYGLKSPGWRLIWVTFATAATSLSWAAAWSDAASVRTHAIVLSLGMFLASLSKHANDTINPVWPFVNSESGGWNKIGIYLYLLAAYESATRTISTPSTPSPSSGDSKPEDRLPPPADSYQTDSGRSFRSTIAAGSLLFSIHRLLMDPTTLVTWSWTGYPIKGPVPNMHGTLTHVAQALGLIISTATLSTLPTPSILLSVTRSPAWFAFGGLGATVLYRYKDWTGFGGGLAFACFLTSIIPNVLSDLSVASSDRVGKTYFTTWLVVILFLLADVWTVAYAFVPGGVYLRERTDLVLGAQVLCLLPAFQWPGLPTPLIADRVSAHVQGYARSTVALLVVLSAAVSLCQLPVNVPTAHKPGRRMVTAGIWTVHFGIDNEGRDSQRRMRDLINEMSLDVVGLLETDLHRIVYGNRDLTRVIARDLGYYVDIGPGPNQHTWGAVLLSKFPILKSTHHLLPSPHGELAPCIEAVLDMYGTNVTVLVAHNGQEEDALDRELQASELARIMASIHPDPVIFLGYVVTKPKAPKPSPYLIMTTDGLVHDIDGDDFDRWCEYIFYRGLYRTAYARISRGTITDTELQVGQFVVPPHGQGVGEDSHEARYLRSLKEDLHEDHWMPMEFYGNEDEGGVRGHYYHVFNTPLYYKIPPIE